MPAKGKHRRPKSQRITRTFAVAGTGGAALALPLLGATGANAAPAAAAKTVPAQSPQSAPAGAKQSAPAAAPATSAATYAVKSGDCLSAIADRQDVDGGWERLYEDNRSVVGDNPNRILPGMQLKLDGKAKASTAESAPKAESKPEPKPESEPAQQSADSAPSAQGNSSEGTSAGGFTAPVDASISTNYRTPGGMWSSGYHTGTDFVVSSGTPIKAIGAGTVVSAGWSGSYGNEVVIQHEDGHYSQYAHMTSVGVSAGQSVSGGDQIGLSGSTGNSTGPHLHFEVRTGPSYGSDVDPLAYLRSHGVTV
ncbi:LysM peptidoglycan-binding domain-containing protein [Streptomyces triticagri]|uniref:LysM peptidoglycan-binding domain-containing protein n=1 Tax=Streptomyces triticagri TaxID=2293568 RepID=A0A372MA69_9ACTN|nr:M23 family metallopeptidase [Streptomyces triticagri]RFU87816.1 LysM peptidoglycan-binding domain-containing protein [Streptomyces triticagri]